MKDCSAIAGSGEEAEAASLPIPDAGTSRWNFWLTGSEAALFATGVKLLGPMTLIPFLFQRLHISNAWLAMFNLAPMIMALGGPIGTALAGGRRWKLPFCLRMGVLQRLPYLAVPLGAMFLFDKPVLLLVLLVCAWIATGFVTGIVMPVYQVVITNGVREAWWGRMMSLPLILGGFLGFAATGIVWAVNRRVEAPTNYVALGWMGILLLCASFVVVSRLREVPAARELPSGWNSLGETWGRMFAILRDDPHTRWIVLARSCRTAGFLVGTYMTATLIERCALAERQMWVPVILITVTDITACTIAGWFVDHAGVKTGLVLSSIVVMGNSLFLLYAHTLPHFVVVFFLGSLAGSLLGNSWGPLLMKIAPPSQRAAYFASITLGAAPGTMVFMLLGLFTVYVSGFRYVYLISATGGLIAMLLFLFKLPRIGAARGE